MIIFIMIELAAEMKELLSVNNELFKGAFHGGKYVDMDNYHITLKYLGDVDKIKLPLIEAAIKDCITRSAPFILKCSKPDYFNKEKHKRTTIYRLSGSLNKLEALRSSIEGALFLKGFPRDDREFAPHITIARRIGHGEMTDVTIPPNAIEVGEVCIMESVHKKNKTTYNLLSRIPFQGGKLIVESIEDGVVILENRFGYKIKYSLDELPENLKEGDVLLNYNSIFEIDNVERKSRREEIHDKLYFMLNDEHIKKI